MKAIGCRITAKATNRRPLFSALDEGGLGWTGIQSKFFTKRRMMPPSMRTNILWANSYRDCVSRLRREGRKWKANNRRGKQKQFDEIFPADHRRSVGEVGADVSASHSCLPFFSTQEIRDIIYYLQTGQGLPETKKGRLCFFCSAIRGELEGDSQLLAMHRFL